MEEIEKEFYKMFYKTVGERGVIHSSEIFEWFRHYLLMPNNDSAIKYLYNQKRIGLELGTPRNEIELIDNLIIGLKGMQSLNKINDK